MGAGIEDSTMGRKAKRKPQSVKGRGKARVPRAPLASAEELKAAPRALLGREDKPRRMRPEPRDDASVEDPLRDWPEE